MIYSRVSTDEQADRGFSLRDQEARLREHCERTGREVVAHFQDDASAKTFDRPAFQRMLARIRSAPGSIDEVLVVKWDRYSRDMTGALDMIRRLSGLGVEVQAIEQPIDFDVPEQQMLLVVYVAVPEVENCRRSINTVMGIRRALREGRWCNAAPKGYRFSRDEHNKPLLVPTEDAALIREAFEVAAHTDLAISEILVRLRKRGLKCSRSTLYGMLQRPIYKGYVEIPAWRDEPYELIRGLHEPIVPAEVWDRVQEVRFDAKAEKKQLDTWGGVRPEFPLRGHLACPSCSSEAEPTVVTASLSRGNGGAYAYYHCHRCGGFRARSADVHEAVPAFLRGLRLPKGTADVYRALAEEMGKTSVEEREAEKKAAAAEVERVEGKLLRADEMYFEGELEADSYGRLKAKLKGDLDRARQAFELAEQGDGGGSVTPEAVKNAADVLEALPQVWSRADASRDAEALHDLIGSIVPGKVTFEGGVVRTMGEGPKICLQTPKKLDADPGDGSVSNVAPRVGE